MAKKIIQMYDKYQSTTKVYPKIIEECLPEDVIEKINEGGIPTITITVEQMLSQTTAQLTDEQFNIIKNNSFINVVLPTGQSIGFNRLIDALGDYHLVMCEGSSREITYFTGDINSTTKVVTISLGDIPAGKQLYQHNIYFSSGSSYDYTISIISEDITPITQSNVSTKLATYLNKNLIASGWYADSGEKIISRAVFINDNGTYKMKLHHTQSSYVAWSSFIVIEDAVNPL